MTLAQWRRFAESYVRYGNIRRAAREAGYSESHSYSTILKRPEVQAFITEYQAELREVSQIETSEVLDKYLAILRTEITDVIDLSGDEIRLRGEDELTPEARLAIQEINLSAKGLKVKLYSRLEAGRDLARMLGLFKADNEQSAEALARASEAIRRHTGLLPTDEQRERAARGDDE